MQAPQDDDMSRVPASDDENNGGRCFVAWMLCDRAATADDVEMLVVMAIEVENRSSCSTQPQPSAASPNATTVRRVRKTQHSHPAGNDRWLRGFFE